jgi:hypothetical protein
MADPDTKVLLMIIVPLRRCQKLLFVGAVTMVLSSLLLLSCEDGAGPTESTPIGGAETGTVTEDTSLAGQIQGTFIGAFQNPSMSTAQNNYQIIVSKIDDTSVQVAPASGSASSTFVANLEPYVQGSVTSILLKAPEDILANNGTFGIVGSVGRLSYAYHLGGSDSGNVEVFTGTKQ